MQHEQGVFKGEDEHIFQPRVSLDRACLKDVLVVPTLVGDSCHALDPFIDFSGLCPLLPALRSLCYAVLPERELGSLAYVYSLRKDSQKHDEEESNRGVWHTILLAINWCGQSSMGPR